MKNPRLYEWNRGEGVSCESGTKGRLSLRGLDGNSEKAVFCTWLSLPTTYFFFCMSSYKGLKTKKNFKVGSNEIAARPQYLKKKPASCRARSHHTVCRTELGEVGQFAE